ncbi:MraY family glycosyltransferase [Marinifilum sp. D737]|uniref:MraY family glycosyltransferase n=1 Tax=Marinifilum sp. D737 TaxID=2969628 RepID=UPI002273746A|nr:MraY family glycosyltransferase [Marinifilum sp. D737]MCY1635016.1 undecaprenyl/decaprenyl-phosphate alpha-N-acetylglucosaminyl 1-phosphate transferase [Marinifilum sp. D737]
MLSHEDILFLAFAFLISWMSSYLSIPSIVTVARAKNLCAESIARSSHSGWVPNLGGVALFASLMLGMNFFGNGTDTNDFHCLMGGMVILFFFGIKDDVLVLDPVKKLAGQVVVSLIMVYFADVRLDHFHGFLGLHEIYYPISLLISVFAMVVIINAYNLIDGIDGLASGVGLVCSGSFTIWFVINGFYTQSLIGVSLMGALCSFFYFNVYSRRNKLFMGDTGSMIVGLVLGYFVMKFIQLNGAENLKWQIGASPAVAFGILIVPLFDVIRVMMVRISRKRSPFHADKSHIHHLLLRAGFTHKGASFRIIFGNIAFVVLCYFGRDWHSEILFAAVIGFAIVLTMWVIHMAKRRRVIRFVFPFGWVRRRKAA